MCLKTAFDNFIFDKKTYAAPDTVRYYMDSVSGFLSWLDLNGVTDPALLSEELLKRYLLYLRDVRQIKNTSIHTYFRGIRNFCLFCIEHNYCDYFNYKIRLPRPDPALVLPLSSAEVVKIYDYIKDCAIKNIPSYYLMVSLMLDMGLRLSEVINLNYSDVDLDKGILKVVDSKYNKSRMLPVPDSVFLRFKPFYNTYQPTSLHYISLSDSGIESFFSRMKKSTGIQRLHPHLLRHTFATSYMLQRGNLEFLRMYLGHSSYDVTKRYIHISSELMICSYDCYQIDPIFK